GDDSYTSNIVSYKKSQLEKGEVVTHYEPPAPSPDYPSEITSLNNFDVVSSVGGRNLLPNSKELKVTSNTRYLTYKLSRPIKSGEQYTVSIGSREWITKVKDHNTVLVSSRDAQGDSGIGDGVGKAYGVPIGGSFTLRNDSTNQSIDTILFYGSDINEISGNVEIYKDVKVELGDYSPYSQAPEDILPDTKSDTIYKTNITLPEPLRSVGDVKDRLFRDNAGLLKIERNVGEYTFDGSEGWRFRTNDAGTFVDHNWYQLDIENDNYIDGKGTSSHFKKITTNYNDEEHIRIYGSTVLMWFGVFLKKEKVPDLAVFKKWLASENKKGSPLTVNFLHATPKIETLSQEFQDKLNNIATFKDDNYVYTALDKSDILSPELHATFKSSGWYDRFKLEDTAEKHSAELVIQSDMIATKVASKDYESKMIQLDKEIASKVKSDEYESYKLQTDKIIADKVSSGDFSTYRTQTDKAIVDRVQKGETVSQINIEAGRTLIQSGKILLDGDTYILGTTFANDIKTKSIEAVRADIIELRTRILTANVIESNMLKVDQALINKLTVDEALANRLVAKTAFIQAVKTTSLSADQMTTGILNAAKVNLINMNADNITTGTLTGIELSAVGSSSRFRVRGGDAQFTNDEGQWVNILPTGLYGYDKAGGRRFQVDESLVTSSALGTSVSNVYLAAKTGATSGADGEARVVRYSTLGGDGAVGSYGYLPIRADSLKGAPGVNLYIVTDEEVRITSDNSPSASYKNLRANGLYAGFFTTTTKSMWLGTDSTVHVVAKGSIDKPSNIYRDLRADNLIGNAVVYSGLNGYVGVDNEFRVMNIGLSGTYRDVRAANYIGSAFITSTKNAYIGTDADLLVMDKGLSGSYKDVRAHNFIKASSRELKENITDYNKYTLNNIMELQTVEYNMKESEDKEIGFISEDSPLIASKDGKAVSGYAMDTLALKGIQELTKISNQFDYMLSDHGKEIYCLKQQIKELKKELNK
ncbi:MAG: tail fiber domain-containing protein, partial [Pisciglobus halotolerans]|nr:tail fiber domain-containing protein [Pisciglobus halotolerans]